MCLCIFVCGWVCVCVCVCARAIVKLLPLESVCVCVCTLAPGVTGVEQQVHLRCGAIRERGRELRRDQTTGLPPVSTCPDGYLRPSACSSGTLGLMERSKRFSTVKYTLSGMVNEIHCLMVVVWGGEGTGSKCVCVCVRPCLGACVCTGVSSRVCVVRRPSQTGK